jgi:hypothetical protein
MIVICEAKKVEKHLDRGSVHYSVMLCLINVSVIWPLILHIGYDEASRNITSYIKNSQFFIGVGHYFD